MNQLLRIRFVPPYMRDYLLAVCTLLSTSLFALDGEINEGVWIDGDSFYESIKHKKRSTIYFSDWSVHADQFLKDENYFVALQLNERFDPLPNDKISLPSLSTIAAIGDKELRKAYYKFLENFGRTNGINHVVLPDTTGFNKFQKEVINEANQYSPFYFLNKSSLSYSLPSTKKDFESEVENHPIIWIAGQDDNISKIKRWSKKVEKEDIGWFYNALKAYKISKYNPAKSIPDDLSESIFSSSVIAIDPHQVFPLTDQVVTYLGMDQGLKKRLSQYVNVLDYRVPGVTCIVDNRRYAKEIQEGDILISTDKTQQTEQGIILPEIRIEDQDLVIAKMLFGASGIKGRSDHLHARQISNQMYLGYSDLEREGFNTTHLSWIDSIAADAIKKFATPGMQLAVVKSGSIVKEVSYGHYTYDSLMPVSNDTRYDIASVTKVVATLPAIALLIDQGKIQLDDSVSIHLDSFKGSNKSGVTIRQLLAHNAGLRAYVPFWSMVMDGDRLDAFYYKNAEDEANDVRTYGLEPHPSMADSLKSFIVQSKLIDNPKEYRYSDLGFMILHLLVEEVSGMSFEEFLKVNFYLPMGLNQTGFNPVQNGVSPKEIAPTEYDERYRSYQVWGEVHDRNALVFGGAAGHAGLFSTASDLAKMMYLFINNGFYGGKQYISKQTIEKLNSRYFENNRRGLGWDKKDGDKDSASSLASDASFGHTGFTGTMVWADPKTDLIFVFLSNRIYPDAENWKLMSLNTRTRIHDVLYQSLENPETRN
ncbi:serine hydrolase domain-containing protein [Ekhidna sp.]